jgi:hypothetical protein
MQFPNGRLWMAAAVLGMFAGNLAAQSPIIIVDGSVCLADPDKPFPNDSTSSHQREFELAEVWVETSTPKKECAPAAECSGEECRTFADTVKKVVVEYRDGRRRPITVVFASGNMQMKLVPPFNQWRSPLPERNMVSRNGKIERISVDGTTIPCPADAQCRVTIRPRQAP